MKKFALSSQTHREVIDLTDKINEELSQMKTKDGTVRVFVAHTTCAVTTADLDPGTDLDLLDAIEKMFPQGNYRHPHDPSHVGEHIMSSITGPSVTIPVENGKMILGQWQRVILVELAGPRTRNIVVTFSAE